MKKLVPRKKILKEKRFQNCVIVDDLSKSFTHSAKLTCFRSSGNRAKDYRLAHEHWDDIIIDGQELEIHHCLDGWVALIPKSLHRSIPHDGYMKRLSLSA